MPRGVLAGCQRGRRSQGVARLGEGGYGVHPPYRKFFYSVDLDRLLSWIHESQGGTCLVTRLGSRFRISQRTGANSNREPVRSFRAPSRRFPYARSPLRTDAPASVRHGSQAWPESIRVPFAGRECVSRSARRCPLPCLQHGCMLWLTRKLRLTLSWTSERLYAQSFEASGSDADLALHCGICVHRFCGHTQVSSQDTRASIRGGASSVGESPLLWRWKAQHFARWPVSRRNQFPSPERSLFKLAKRKPLRRSQTVMSRGYHSEKERL